MTAPFTMLKQAKLQADAGTFPVRDLLFSPAHHRLVAILTDIGGLLRSTEAMIRATRLGQIDPETGHWQSTLTPEEVLSAPTLSEEGAEALPVNDWPPLVIGPFGAPYSPLLLAAQLIGAPGGESADLPNHLERWSDWDGALIFGPEGEMAHIRDLHVDLTTGAILEVTISAGEERFTLPLSGIRHFVSQEGYAVTDLRLSDIRAGITTAVPGPTPPEQSHQGWVAA